MKWIDLPPVWLAVFIALAWIQSSFFTYGLEFGGGWNDFAGGVLIGAGILLIALALVEFRRQSTTIHPHETPGRLIQSGIFKRTRNPIYLGDACILAGLVLRFDAVLALPLVPIFIWVIERRFIIAEEDRLRRVFRTDYARYERKVRRWV